MTRSLKKRIVDYAIANRHRAVWRKRLLAVCYGAGLVKLNSIKEQR